MSFKVGQIVKIRAETVNSFFIPPVSDSGIILYKKGTLCFTNYTIFGQLFGFLEEELEDK